MKALSPDPLGWRPKSQLVDFSIAAFGTSTQCVGKKKFLETCLSAPKSIYGFPGNSRHCWDIQVVANFEASNLAHGSSGIFLLAVCFIHAPPCSGLWDQPHNLQGECKIKVWDSVFKLKSQGSDKGALKQAQGSLKGGALGHWPWVTAQVKCPQRELAVLSASGKLDPANSSAVCFWLCSPGRRPWQSWPEGKKENILFLGCCSCLWHFPQWGRSSFCRLNSCSSRGPWFQHPAGILSRLLSFYKGDMFSGLSSWCYLCVNIIQRSYTDLDSIAYSIPSPYGTYIWYSLMFLRLPCTKP